MSDDREKLLKIMSSLEADYRSGKISADKYSYFRSKYEDKLNTIDAKAATRRIRSMQGKSANNNPTTRKKKRSRKPTGNKKREEQDLVQKYIIDPKKGDAKYNRNKKSSMDSGTFKLLLLLILVIGFTAGVAYGIFNFDFSNVPDSDSVAIVQDTAFPEIKEVNVTNSTSYTTDSNYSDTDIETTIDDSGSSSDSQGGGGNTPTDSADTLSQTT